jgi:hypothetical protein
MEAVDGFEPKEEASDPLWEIYYANVNSDSIQSSGKSVQLNSVEQKVTPLFKE